MKLQSLCCLIIFTSIYLIIMFYSDSWLRSSCGELLCLTTFILMSWYCYFQWTRLLFMIVYSIKYTLMWKVFVFLCCDYIVTYSKTFVKTFFKYFWCFFNLIIFAFSFHSLVYFFRFFLTIHTITLLILAPTQCLIIATIYTRIHCFRYAKTASGLGRRQ